MSGDRYHSPRWTIPITPTQYIRLCDDFGYDEDERGEPPPEGSDTYMASGEMFNWLNALPDARDMGDPDIQFKAKKRRAQHLEMAASERESKRSRVSNSISKRPSRLLSHSRLMSRIEPDMPPPPSRAPSRLALGAQSIVRSLSRASKHLFSSSSKDDDDDVPANPISYAPKLLGDKPLKFAFLGDCEAGKTALIVRFTKGGFVSRYWPSVLELYPTSLQVDGVPVNLEFWDVPSKIGKNQQEPLTMAQFDAIFICVPIDNEANIASVVEKWRPQVAELCPAAPVYLLGTKADLRSPVPTLRLRFLDETFPITSQQGAELAVNIGASGYLETSAKTGQGVNEAFKHVVRDCIITRLASSDLLDQTLSHTQSQMQGRDQKRNSQAWCFHK